VTCSNDPTGFIPLDYVAGSYQGYAGGLYGGGTNLRPAQHDLIGRQIAAAIRPLDSDGNRDDASGKYLMVGLGMSHCHTESSAFNTKLSSGDYPGVHSQWDFVSGAIGGPPSGGIVERMVEPTHDFWTQSKARVVTGGYTAAQVSFGWLKTAISGPAAYYLDSGLTFPDTAHDLAHNMLIIARNARTHYPNLKLLFISSRSYGGYSDGTTSPEPWAYEQGFAVKWAIHRQISGGTYWVPAEATHASVGPDSSTPWISWGPYIWADGASRPNKIERMMWVCPDDYEDDYLHPTDASGGPKVADALDSFLSADSVMRQFYRA